MVKDNDGKPLFHRQNLKSCTEAMGGGYNITSLIDGYYSKVDKIDWNDIKDVGHIMSLLDKTMSFIGVGCAPKVVHSYFFLQNPFHQQKDPPGEFVYVINYRRDLAKWPVGDKYPFEQTKNISPPIDDNTVSDATNSTVFSASNSTVPEATNSTVSVPTNSSVSGATN